ncbi:ABC transporter permease [Thiorhodococcus minor]|uniref:ABC transporter permease n=1 Tax=Thiorhodococcus minor TaxID=57489 RepID=A0A6M0JU29_9GAMM|nr:ABC transporter permease [Thiorhodococcus minor]
MGLLRRASLRDLARHPWQSGLSILGIALGVAVVIAVDVANSSATRAFDLSVQQVAGRATHRIEAASGRIPDSLFVRLRQDLRATAASPIIEATIKLGSSTLTLIGLDLLTYTQLRSQQDVSKLQGNGLAKLLSTPGALLLDSEDARHLGVAPGDRIAVELAGRQETARVVAVMDSAAGSSSSGLAIADISTAQELTGRLGLIDHVDLVLEADEVEAARARLPPGLRLVDAGQRGETFRQMTRAFRINLTAMGLLAMLVGGFIIYNTMTFAVLRRRRLLGSLRTLGCTRGQLFSLVVGEAMTFAAIGALLGVALGILTGWGLVQLVTRTINDLYFALAVSSLDLGPAALLKGVCIGALVTLIGALGPAFEAARSQPREVLQETGLERRANRWVLGLAMVGLILTAIGWLATLIPSRSLTLGFAALMVLILGYSFCVPALLKGLARSLTPWAGRTLGLPGLLAGRGIDAAILRTGIAAAALTIAVATTVGVGVMIDSFRASLVHWLAGTLRSDIYVTLPNDSGADKAAGLPSNLAESLRGIPGIADVSLGRAARVTTADGSVRLLALESSSTSHRGFAFEGREVEELWPRFERGEAMLASEPFAYHRQLSVGDRVGLFTPGGWRDLEIGGIFRDYGSDNGMLVLARQHYVTLWQDDAISSLGLVLEPGTDGQGVFAAARRLVEVYDRPILVTRSAEIRERSLAIFDQTFAITQVLRLLAIGVAFVGILSALMALQLERRREYAIMRATGMTRGQLGILVLTQTSMLGLAAGILALPLGLLMGELLIQVINLRSFGWSMEMTVKPSPLISGVLMAWLAAFLAGVYPAWQSTRADPARALRAE